MLRSVAFALSFLLSLALGCGGGTPGTGTGGNNGGGGNTVTGMREQAVAVPDCIEHVNGQITRPSCSGTVENEAVAGTASVTISVDNCEGVTLVNDLTIPFTTLEANHGVTIRFNPDGVTRLCGKTTLTYTRYGTGQTMNWKGGIVGDIGLPYAPIALQNLTPAPLPMEVGRTEN